MSHPRMAQVACQESGPGLCSVGTAQLCSGVLLHGVSWPWVILGVLNLVLGFFVVIGMGLNLTRGDLG